ncbi:inhibitory synaptic factor 2A isoform X2 [Perognathus longimembris pacificus]|uniref:inhibitory synaptic factor 2A isoform X2 n=1 Tax=Perognathus longimembris pacificus TaxID=214514 RepID=UPI0020190BAC|nr:inhibitory synaptic factor 2A isoform X2 [Perognathus longimembris pacificus]
MVSKDSGSCALTTPEREVEVEMKYALDPNRQIKKRNKALQVRFKDICEAQNEQREPQPAASSGPGAERPEARPVSCRAAYRKYMTVPARRSIPNVTKSTGVQTSPDLKKCYQTFPLDRKKGNLKGVPGADPCRSHDNGFLPDARERGGEAGASGDPRPCSAGRVHKTTALVFHSHEHMNALEQPLGVNCAEPLKSPDEPGHPDPLLQSFSQPPSEEPAHQLEGRARPGGGTPDSEEPPPPAHGRVFKTEVAAEYPPAVGARTPEPGLSNSAAASQGSLCPAEEEQRRAAHLNGLQRPQGPAAACSPPVPCLAPECGGRAPPRPQPSPTAQAAAAAAAATAGEESQQIVPHTEVVDLKAQLQVMENLISSSQETIKVLLGVIQELEKGEAHREGVELDFKQQEDKLQPVLKKLHPIEETQVVPSPYTQETYSSTPKQKSKTESKKHGRWKLWFL